MKTTPRAPDPLVSTLDQDLAERVAIFLQMKRPELGNLLVSASDGNVELRGCVSTYYLRQLAISVTQHVAGVLHVIDRIEVFEKLPLQAKMTRSRLPK